MKVLVVGSGLSAYGACIALLDKNKENKLKIDVIDIGLKNSNQIQNDYEVYNSKDYQGSFFPYGINDSKNSFKLYSKRICSSHAFGGFSKVYSGSILRPKSSDLIDWPEEAIPSTQDYERIFSSLDFEPPENDLSDFFLRDIDLQKYNSQNSTILGNSLIAFSRIIDKNGKSISIPFDSSIRFTQWEREKKIKYTNNSYLVKIKSNGGILIAVIKENNKLIKRKYNKIYLGSGCVNTTAIVDKSLFSKGSRVYSIKSVPSIFQLYLKLPFRNKKQYPLKDINNNYKLCNFFLEHKSKFTSKYWTHTQIGPINEIILKKLKDNSNKIFHKFFVIVCDMFLFSSTVFHSDLGKKILLKSNLSYKINGSFKEQNIHIVEKENNLKIQNSIAVKFAVLKKIFDLALLPIPFSNFLANKLKGNKYGGWHYGGTIPFSSKYLENPFCKPSGQVEGLSNVFVIDSSSFPSIPGSTVALLTMANAHRIAKNSLNNL